MVEDDSKTMYDVVRVDGIFDCDESLGRLLVDRDLVFAVVDASIDAIHGSKLRRYLARHARRFHVARLKPSTCNETNKSVGVWTDLLVEAISRSVTERGVYLAVGGGVTSDLVGFLASTTRRGIDYIAIPTTLTAMVDAAISPKTALNVGGMKNIAATVYPPSAVLWDPSFLRTDPVLRTGLAELIKLAIVRSAPLFDHLESNATQLRDTAFQSYAGLRTIDRGIRLFLKMKQEHPYPGNRPASLRSYGHAFSRRLESEVGFRLDHGQCVSIEMAVAANLSSRRGLLPEIERDRIASLLSRLGLLPECPACRLKVVWPEFEGRYRSGRPFHFPVPRRIGQGTFFDRFERDELQRAVLTFRRFADRCNLDASGALTSE